MTPREYVEIARARWRSVVAGLLFGLLVAVAVTVASPREYSSAATIFVSAQAPGSDPSTALEGGELSAQRIATYLEVLGSSRIASEVADELGQGISAGEVADNVVASTTPDTVLLTVTATDVVPQRAADIANLVAARFIANVAELERPAGPDTIPVVNARVFEQASPSNQPVSPLPGLNIGLGFALGLILGLGIALLRNTLDTSVKSREQLRKLVEVPILGAIDSDRKLPLQPLAIHEDPQSRVAEAFRQVRTNLQFVNVDRDQRVLLVTSPSPGDGKTTTVCNLAIAMADSGNRVLVIEADLRRPRAADYFDLDRTVGLTNVLARRMQWEQAVRRWRRGLDVLSSGPIPPNPSELLGSGPMVRLLDEVRTAYDVVLIDASPLSPVTDAAALAPRADGVLLVVRYGTTSRQVGTAVEALDAVSAPLIGAVMTMVPAKRQRRYVGADPYQPDSVEAVTIEPRRSEPDSMVSQPGLAADETVVLRPVAGAATSTQLPRPSPSSRRGTQQSEPYGNPPANGSAHGEDPVAYVDGGGGRIPKQPQ